MSADEHDITKLLQAWKGGDCEALDRIAPLVYQELRRLADRYLRDEHAAQTLQPTALVHDLYLRMVGGNLPDWTDRGHFFGIAAHRMRQILVEHARQKHASKRGGDAKQVTLDEMVCFAPQRGGDVIALDEALNKLAAFDKRKCKVIELRYFAGLGVAEVAESMGISVATIGREQRLAEAWLKRYMTEGMKE